MSQDSKVMTKIADDHPMKVAWDFYKETDDYANTRKWALQEEHVDGSLWTAFCVGWNHNETNILDHKPTIHELEDILDSEPGRTRINADGSVTVVEARQK